ncbi:tRNA lysidine(34) synthetase TilS [Roseibium algae]|uniref:tRNA(Ile)-lysidine synthase n=1 Tax=Roseibium algae TaxID=3123038 RepID=A0ABU8TFW7_9HYPH
MNAAVPNVPDQTVSGVPLGTAEVDVLFKDLFQFSCLALGVSGGADSVALLRSMHAWQVRSGWSGKLVVLTVDHCLRTGSADDAEFVHELCASLHLRHKILVWEGDKPSANLQGEARNARYALMAEAMHNEQADALVLAHHQGDQVETFLDRLTRGSGVYGLGGMADDEPAGPEGLRIIRPFLDVPKDRLVSHLKDLGQTWCEDPSNQNEGFKRVRLRNLVASLADEGLQLDRLLETTRRLRRTADAIDIWVERVFADDVEVHPAGPCRLGHAAYVNLPEEIRLRLLSRLIRSVSGQTYSSRLVKLEKLDQALCADQATKNTLGGVIVMGEAGKLYFWKELGREALRVMDLEPGCSCIWDKRFHVSVMVGSDTGDSLYLGRLADAPFDNGTCIVPSGWPKQVFSSAPAVWDDQQLLFAPGLFGSDTAAELGIKLVTMVNSRSSSVL